MEHIASRENERVKFARKLAGSGAFRAQQGLFFAEGKRLCFDLATTLTPHTVFVTGQFLKANPKAENLCADTFIISQPVDDKLADTKTPQGIYCLFNTPSYTLAGVDMALGLLVCEAVQNPDNVGAALRSAAAFGLGGVALLPGSADPFAPKALRAGMGAACRLPVVTGVSLAQVAGHCKSAGATLYAAALQDARPLGQVQVQKPFALLVGNEGAGLTKEALALANQRVYIPMHHGTESLNAAVAASVLMFYFKNMG